MIGNVHTYSGIFIQLDSTPLAAGGEGSIHRITAPSNYLNRCAKILHPLKRTESKTKKIEFLVKNKPSNCSGTYYMLCWPEEIIFNASNQPIGYIMSLAHAGSEKLYELTRNELPPKFGYNWNKYDRTNSNWFANRLKLCCNIAIAVHQIHLLNKYSIVDCKPQNILITCNGLISITDIDSFQISASGLVLHRGEVVTPEYAPPESATLNPAEGNILHSWDRFSLAVSFYEILCGIHPFTSTSNGQYSDKTTIEAKIKCGLFVHGSKKNHLTVIPNPHTMFNSLPGSIKNLFIKAFENGHIDPRERPSAEEWGKILFSLTN